MQPQFIFFDLKKDFVEPIVKQKIEQVGSLDRSGRSYLPIGKCIVIPRNNYYLFVAPTMSDH